MWVRGVAVESLGERKRGERPAVQKEEEKNNFAQSEIIFTLRWSRQPLREVLVVMEFYQGPQVSFINKSPLANELTHSLRRALITKDIELLLKLFAFVWIFAQFYD